MKHGTGTYMLLASLVFLAGCTSSSGTAPDVTPAPPEDSGTEAKSDVVIFADVRNDAGPPPELPDSADPDSAPFDSGAETNDIWQPQPCLTHADCLDGFCVEFPPGSGEFLCAPTCIEECPADWGCKSVYVDGPDPVSICLPPVDTLCKVCGANADCLLAGSLCILGDGPYGYCGKVCDPQGDECPDEFACGLYGPGEDPLGYQCMPQPGGCCVAGAWASCDDDNPCTLDSCSPSLGCTSQPTDETCIGTDPCQQYVCVDGECVGTPTVGDFTLDGIDDDCDGNTDEDAYKDFSVSGWAYVSTAGQMSAQDAPVTISGSLGAAPWADTSSGGIWSVVSGLYAVWGVAKQ